MVGEAWRLCRRGDPRQRGGPRERGTTTAWMRCWQRRRRCPALSGLPVQASDRSHAMLTQRHAELLSARQLRVKEPRQDCLYRPWARIACTIWRAVSYSRHEFGFPVQASGARWTPAQGWRMCRRAPTWSCRCGYCRRSRSAACSTSGTAPAPLARCPQVHCQSLWPAFSVPQPALVVLTSF